MLSHAFSINTPTFFQLKTVITRMVLCLHCRPTVKSISLLQVFEDRQVERCCKTKYIQAKELVQIRVCRRFIRGDLLTRFPDLRHLFI